ncbi:MAG: FHA domain-containing protein [Planctomycetota bacterium]|nr:FHA domain-containing protein [Planctomycetota bacterium]
MQDRYSLRFESGERKGESVPVPAGGCTVGRRPGNTLQITAGSVSGKHAELRAGAGGLEVVDLGSTNGTRVAGKKITTATAAHGDRIVFGDVELTLIDASLGEATAAVPAPAAVPAGAGDIGEAVGQVSARSVAKSGERSRAGMGIVLVAVAAAAAGAFFLLGRDGGGGSRTRAVVPVAGNLLAEGFSFEEADSPWSGEESAPAAFLRSGDASRTGAAGLRAELEPGEDARHRSQTVPVSVGRTLTASAARAAGDGAGGRLGIEFLRGGEGAGSLVAWSAWTSATGGFEALDLAAPVPPGTTGARVVAEARAGSVLGGRVDLDDVSLLPAAGAAQPAAQHGEFRLFTLGAPTSTAALYKVGRPLIGDLFVAEAQNGSGPPAGVTLTVAADGGRLAVAAEGANGGRVLSLRVEPVAFEGGLASFGEDGHRLHGPVFERAGVTGVLLGKDRDLVALRFDAPVNLRGVEEGDGVRLRAALGAAAGFAIQLDFNGEREQANTLAYQARQAERAGDLGACLASWARVLAEFPFEEVLVAEAENATGRLVQAGMEELGAVRDEFERASFFRLVDLYRQCRDRARAIGRRFAGSAVEAAAEALVGEVHLALGTLETDLFADEVARLQAIAEVLAATESPRLAAEVGSYLTERYGADE